MMKWSASYVVGCCWCRCGIFLERIYLHSMYVDCTSLADLGYTASAQCGTPGSFILCEVSQGADALRRFLQATTHMCRCAPGMMCSCSPTYPRLCLRGASSFVDYTSASHTLAWAVLSVGVLKSGPMLDRPVSVFEALIWVSFWRALRFQLLSWRVDSNPRR
jgi:hypothetical protein